MTRTTSHSRGRHEHGASRRRPALTAAGVALLAILLAVAGTAQQMTHNTHDGLAARWDGEGIAQLAVDGAVLEGVTMALRLVDPRTGEPSDTARFNLEARLESRDDALWLEGVVTAAGEEETVADLVVRFSGLTIPTGTGDTDLLLGRALLNKLPIVSLRHAADGADRLAAAIPADRQLVYEFRNLADAQASELRLPFGFSPDTRPELRMRAPFAVVLYRTEPRWHFRSALAGYYRLFPERFERREQRHGGWFFANETRNIPNPQHYAYHEQLSGSGPVEHDHERNMGTFPYNETGSQTIRLRGPGLPKDYDDAMRQMAELEEEETPAGWTTVGAVLDDETRRTGNRSLRGRLEGSGSAYAQQFVVLDEPIDEPVVVSGWSRAQDVSASPTVNDYSIYVDARGVDGAWMFGQCAVFSPGTHDWEHSEHVIHPRAPLGELRVYAMFRERSGTAWFDDIRVYRQSRPDENLLENGGFEELGERLDIRYVHDNAYTDEQGRYRVFITDHYGSDVRPTTPLSLLRFICNVDPEWEAPEGRPTPAGRATEFFDRLFAANPDLDGAYIDGAGAWTCWYINHRRDQFRTVDTPLTYAPQSFVVGAHGRFTGYKWLRFLQERYHPQGRTILGNMGPTTDAWPSYTALDIIGIESSRFRDRALMGYHRFGGYTKPVLPMNFINLHNLDDRDTAEEYVLASAQWGHMPSTGRMVREGYESYGDVCHTYYPALIEMSVAGWEPVPLAEGVRAERFDGGEAVYFTIRAEKEGRAAESVVLDEALAGLDGEPVVMDAVQLCPVDARSTPHGLVVPMTDGAEELTILRISSRDNALRWLLSRAAHHCENAAIVRGHSENTDRLNDIAASLRELDPAGDDRVSDLLERIEAELDAVMAEDESLERLSISTELLDARRAVAEWLLYAGGAALRYEGALSAPISTRAHVRPVLTPGRSGAEVIATWALEGRNILRLPAAQAPETSADINAPLTVERQMPGAMTVLAALSVPVPGGESITVIRPHNVHFTPVLRLSVADRVDEAAREAVYAVTVERLVEGIPLVVRPRAGDLDISPAEVALGPADTTAEFRVPLKDEYTDVGDLTFTVLNAEGRLLDEGRAQFMHVPPPPDGDLALAERGVTVTTDSVYSQYSPDPIIDGVWQTAGLHWLRKAWASRDSAGEEGHWLEIQFPDPTPVSEIWIYWNIEGGQVYTARNYDVQVWENDAWRTVAEARDTSPATVTRHEWPVVTTQRVRVHQHQGGGAAIRPHIMWVTEVCLYDRGTLN